jgi:enamine deaminase RidA (YjgF/YER057c/UK114 family)
MWGVSSAQLKPIAALLGILSVTAVSAARGDEPRLSISGYDPVAYFTDGKPVPGKSEFEHLWHKARWRFASAEHRDLFVKEPSRYTPQYDGYCAMGVSNDGGAAHKDTVDPQAWTIVDGKLYLAHSRYWLDVWRENAEENIKRADASWLAMVNLAEPVIVGAPCAASPPTTVVALRDGGHWVVVAGQIARDEAGNVVGKGDWQAQIEQVGKNVGACLKAGGATVKDIVFTVNHVAEPSEFDKYGDLRVRYFGRPSPQSTTVRTPQLPGPDFLVQVEAFAAIK